ncbi:MAPEG family protein [Pseudoalteromonas sp. BDTF-M6]|uniref:MAPEG family protein n=1 Tax=Pseudoalteromonas sp. BDTF-M6 TaxID=2796132 RepID=UPI001BAF8541|nr:MAPEG family protein [Pseudoalteromonas sp. BDTF-M6]MBS3797755.1 MAPEG family protein [Pseudoalteromonas sp. BDTF-M6]
MTSQLIFALFAQVLLTLIVMVIMGRRRFAAARKKQIQMRQFATMDLGNAPEQVQVAGRNFINQFEIPVLFYVAVLCALATNLSGYTFVALAWLFVVTRVLHSVIHLGTNHLRSRYFTFLAGCLVVLAMWLTLVWQLI